MPERPQLPFQSNSIFAKLVPIIGFIVVIFLLIIGFVLFSYLLLFGAAIALILFVFFYIRNRFFNRGKTEKIRPDNPFRSKNRKFQGKTYDHKDL